MPNWGITNFTNPYMLASYGPYAWSSNYGYETQFNIFPDTMTPLMAQYGHGILNPNHISQWNPMFAFPIQNNFTNPQLIAKGLQDAVNAAKAYFDNAMNGIKLNNSAQIITSVISSGNQLIESKDLTDAQKEKVQAVIDKAEALKERVEKYQEDSQNSDADTALLKEKLDAIKTDTDALKKEFVETCKAIKEEIKAAKDQNDKADESDKTDGVDGTEETENTEDTESAAETEDAEDASDTDETGN